MNIHPKAIKQFLNRPRDDHSWLKSVKEKWLDEALEEVEFKPARKDPPLDKHQKVCILLGIANEQFAFWLDMGGGKTRVSLELLNYWWKRGRLKRGLIVGPSEAVLIGWEKQFREWKIKIPYVTLLNSSSATKWESVAELDEGLILATYPGLNRMCSVLKLSGKGKRKKMRLKINQSRIKKLSKNLDAVIMDESTKLGNKKSLFYRTVVKLTKLARYRIELAGRPFGRDPTMLWSQMYILDRGETLGDTLGIFRAAFFKSKPNYWGGTDHKFKKELQKRLNEVLRHKSIEYSEEEMGTKHKVRSKIEEVMLPEENMAYYQRHLEQLKKQVGHGELHARENTFLRMRQISSGFLGVKDDLTGKKASIRFAENPKLDRLIELIEEVPEDRKFVIAHEFIYSGEMIQQALKKLKIKHGWLRGGIKDGREIQDRFDNDPEYRGLILNHKVGGYGTNLQAANYLFNFEFPVPVIDDEQLRKRLPRKGQRFTVHEYDLVARGTADMRILKWHKEGGDLFKAVIRRD
jgi:SNF2 family DNA or RNA helicase